MKLILTRHGETEENKKFIIQGHMPGHLSDRGKQQAEKLAERLKDYRINAIYSSDLKRAADTTKFIAKYHDCPVHYVEELREYECGDFTGKDKRKISWDNTPDNMETRTQAYRRVKKFLDEIYEKHSEDTVLFVSHAGIGRTIVNVIRNEKPEDIEKVPHFDNTAVSVFEIFEDKNHKIHLLNSSDHLYPTREECLKWYEELDTPDNIMRHVKLVNKLANFLAQKLKEKGIRVNLDLVDKASLLHDLDKWLCIQDKSLSHGFETEKILTEKGYPYLGYVARQHRGDLISKGLNTWEEKIISYADKRVLQDEIVSLEKRYEYINKKYPPKDKKKRQEQIKLFNELENEIFSKLELPPGNVKKLLVS